MADSTTSSTSSSIFTNNLPDAGNAAYGGTAPTSTFTDLVHNILLAVFSILGVIFLCLTVYAGFLWMTAMGDTKKVQKAKDILGQSMIGLVICLLAYAITYYITGWVVTLG